MWGDPAQRGNAQNYCGNNPINRVDPLGLDDSQPSIWEEAGIDEGAVDREIALLGTRGSMYHRLEALEEVLEEEFGSDEVGKEAARRAWREKNGKTGTHEEIRLGWTTRRVPSRL